MPSGSMTENGNSVEQNAASKAKLNILKIDNLEDAKRLFHYTGPDTPIISGHRGGSAVGYPENCIATFERTLSATPAIFEIDPRLTRDGAAVLMHDATLDRTSTGRGPVRDQTLEEVQAAQLKDLVGDVTPYHPPTLDEAIAWCIGKTILDLDVKDLTIAMKSESVKKRNAWGNVIFTVHTALDARAFYDLDPRSLFAAVIFNEEGLKSYEAAGIPWENIALGFVGNLDKPENKPLYEMLHKRGVKAMVAAGPTYDKLPSVEERAEAYRQVVKGGADIIESDRPIEVANALKELNLSALW